MKVCGIICEYNPFHNGHLYHIKKTKEVTQCELLICVMSGNFVQRGEPAITNKWERAKCAAEHGADLVIELPFLYATQSAAYFAQAAVHLLALAQADCICFGSESNELDKLIQLSELNPTILQKKGQSTVQAYEEAYGSLLSNDILALNYLKAIKEKDIVPYCIQRTNHYLDEELSGSISSATSIRKALERNQEVKHTTPMHIEHPIFLKDYYPLIQYLLSTCSSEYLSSLFLMDEGIENMLKKNAVIDDFDVFMDQCISKRYTRSKIQRTLIHLLNQTTKKEADLPLPDYLRPLAFNAKGQAYLKQLSKQVTIASRFNQIPAVYREMEWKAASVYAWANPMKRSSLLQQELQPPCFISSY